MHGEKIRVNKVIYLFIIIHVYTNIKYIVWIYIRT